MGSGRKRKETPRYHRGAVGSWLFLTARLDCKIYVIDGANTRKLRGGLVLSPHGLSAPDFRLRKPAWEI